MRKTGDIEGGKSGRSADAAAAPTPPEAGRWLRDAQGEPLPDELVLEPDGGFWVFAYGSLMWDPGFHYAERREAVLPGYRRSFCLWSIHYRGTPERPGLVLGLDRDEAAATRGVAYRVAAEYAAEARRYIIERELVSAAYFEAIAPSSLLCPTTGSPKEERRTLTYVIDRGHEQYAGDLSLAEQAAVIAASAGPKGPNWEYLANTVSHLREMGLSAQEIGDLAELEAGVAALRNSGS